MNQPAVSVERYSRNMVVKSLTVKEKLVLMGNT